MRPIPGGCFAALGLWLMTPLGCAEKQHYPPPVYVDYTRAAPAPSPGAVPGGPAPAAPAAAATDAGPTIGDALAPFGIVLPPNVALLKLPPPSVWQNWPFTWPNLPGQPAPGSGSPSAAPPAAPAPASPAPVTWAADEASVLDETNRRRAQGARCGTELLPPAPPLQPSSELQRAAREHSEDMARNDYFDHTARDGRTVEQRTRAAGFPGGFIGENIAAGREDARATVQQWIDSPGHCLNIMEPRYRFLGVGHAVNPGTRLRHFWTQNFGG